MNKNEILTNFIIKGLKGINEITENIDLQKTSKQFIQNQLPQSLNESFLKIKYINNQDNIDETFFSFLKDNDQFFQHLKIFSIHPTKEQTLQQHLSEYFNNIHTKYNEDKMFYFYFQLILMENFLGMMGMNMEKGNLKVELMDVLKNHCFMEKKEMSKCLGDHMEEIDVIAMSDFENKINNKCQVPKKNLEQCIIRKLKKS